MAGPSITFDTNVLFYAVDQHDPEKQRRCAAILRAAIETGSGFVTLQALGEFAHAVARKKVLTRREAAQAARDWAAVLGARGAEEEAFDLAVQWWSEDRFSYWDALLLATSVKAGATACISEDLADGMVIGGVEIISPFKTDAAIRIARHGLIFSEDN